MNVGDCKSPADFLKESEQRLADIIDFLPDATFAIDKEGKVIIWNRAIEEMTGVVAENILGKGDYEYAIALYGKRRYMLVDLVLKPNKTFEKETYSYVDRESGRLVAETDLLYLNGKEVFLWGKAGPLYDSKGKIVGAIESIRDITERKQSEKALLESENKYRRLFETTDTGYVILDDQGFVIDANLEYVLLSGRKKVEDVLGHSILEWTAPHDIERNASEVRKCIDQGFIRNLEIDYITPSNQFTPIEMNATVLRSSGTLRILSLCRDITERKRTENELSHSFSLVQAALEATADGLLIVDQNGKISGYNNQFADMWRIPEKILESNDDEHTLDFVLDQLKKPDEYLNLVKTLYGQPYSEHFDIFEFKDGRIFERYTRPQVIRGVAVGRVWSFRDITERKQAEKELRIVHGELEQKVLDRTADLEKTNATLAIMLDYARKTETDIQERVVANLRFNILETLHLLKKQPLGKGALNLVEHLEATTQNLANPFAKNIDSPLLKLTAREIQLANFIRLGKSTKDIMELLNLSARTVESHRDNLRKKLGLSNKKINLRTYLNSKFTE